MEDNIIFSLSEQPELIIKNNLSLDDLNTFYEDTFNTDTFDINLEALEHYYKTTYSVKSLQQILQYYGIPKKNMVKDEMLQCLLFFETEPANRPLVLKRMRLWQNIKELKADTYFAKFINFNI
jgi:hypothetical protein